jgi:protein-tyrosine phosphatase
MRPSEIFPGVWLGGARFLSDQEWEDFAQREGVEFVVTAAKEQKGVCSKARRLRVDVDDHPDENLSRFFPGVCAQLEGARAKNQGILIHCAAGVSRSATLLIAWLMWRDKMSLRQALAWVQSKRPIVQPNSGFLQQLQDWERQIL